MKISSVNFLNTAKIQNQNQVKFGSLNPIPNDVFEKTGLIKTVKIKDAEGNDVKATIQEEDLKGNFGFFAKDPKMISINVDGIKIGYATMYSNKKDDTLFVKELFTEENHKRHYNGAGTELLKCLVEESKKRGFEGRISLSASHCPAPFVFYYKNNFSPVTKSPQYVGAIDYAARNNIPVAKMLPIGLTTLDMELDKKGADALLAGERLYEQKDSKTIAKTNIDGAELEANYTEADDCDFYFQIIDKNAPENQQAWFAKGKILANDDGGGGDT